MKSLFVFVCFALALALSLSAFARDARIDYLVNQGKVTEADIVAAETEGPNNWMAKQAYDIYISGYIQAGWIYTDGGDPDNAFSINRARVQFDGTLGEAWGFVAQVELADDPHLLTTGVSYRYGNGSIFLGQNKVPLVLENITSSSMLETINRSAIATMLDDRDLGLFVDYGFMEGKMGVQAAVTNGTGTNAAETNDNKDYTVRVWGKPFMGSENPADGLMVAGAFSMGDQQELDELEVDLGDFTRTVWVGTVAWTYSGIKVQGEYVNIDQDLAAGGSAETDGWYVLACYDLPMDGMTVTPLAKYETTDPQIGVGGDWVTLGVRLSFVGTHDVKLEANYVMESLDVGDDLDEFILQLQAKF
ncbi:MAG: hypothetical protein JW889_08965 [Verrucomicrobia bacterium]|nr:hypothetical protein [Verrucomicrobiota bacterium]